jgi:hypothetical protein
MTHCPEQIFESLKEICQTAYKPGSVPLLPTVMAIHLERLLPAVSSDLPGHDAGSHLNGTSVLMSLSGLAPDGVYRARPVTRPAVRSYRTISPLPWLPVAVSFLWHFP